MTDEEIDKMADDFVNAQEFTKAYGLARKAECGAFWKYGFLAGLKVGRPHWYKPSEKLPETTVLDEDGNRVFYDYKIKRWRYDDADSTISLTPIAWCEIPTFDKE